jgi:hypothetical protein
MPSGDDHPLTMLTEELPAWLGAPPAAAVGFSMGGFGVLCLARRLTLRAVAVASPALFSGLAGRQLPARLHLGRCPAHPTPDVHCCLSVRSDAAARARPRRRTWCRGAIAPVQDLRVPTDSGAVLAARARAHRLARLITEVFAPAVWAAAMPLVIALHAAESVRAGLAFGWLAVGFCSAVPYAMVWLGVRRGRLTDHHIGQREQRRTPLQFWKLSAHTAISAGSVSVLVMVFGPALLAGAIMVALIGWSRVALGDHTQGHVKITPCRRR